ncbi:DNA polymerase theta [Hyposmocoma kahamanoa]|uniref:DNA polymerase theta n=1 Tax=Hyposmocoma kahamanoa TaxID=1477025 RepID=UPI000E6D8A20|nr:DNA polymerase theta [Hyposmocoma kahamanoa]
MSEEIADVVDTQVLTENVGFLDNCFDTSFALQSSLVTVKEYAAEEQYDSATVKVYRTQTSKKINTTLLCKPLSLDTSISKNAEILSQIVSKDEIKNKNLKDWGLPQEITKKYSMKGIKEMFDWQVTCLGNSKVLLDYCNLVYSAPTSAGKTLVAEILTIKTILERQKKVIIILPFVSIVREKMFYLQDILSSSGIRVEGFMGAQCPPGGLQTVHVAICTIEKANSLVNKLLEDGNISDLGAVIVDELHLLGDPHRGYILELLLTKIKYVSSRLDDVLIQIVGMSATLPNLEVLAHWLNAELFVTQFRPIPLDEFCLVGNKLFDKCGQLMSTIENTKNSEDSDNVLKICLNTIQDGCSVLIFCMTKNRCENLAQNVASSFYKLGCSGNEIGMILRKQLNSQSISEVLEQLKNCPVGLDQIIKNTISFGVAYHHAGLTFDERDIIEGGFKSGAIRILIATSTLSSGVNLPARKVIIRSPVFQRQPINILTYKQMIGRAGRMGKDTKGESILICTEAEKKIGFDLMMGNLDPVKSCIESEDKYMRAVLEIIASNIANTRDHLEFYSKCTLLFTQNKVTPSQSFLLDNTLKELENYELVRIQKDEDETRYIATALGKACLSSSMAPNDGLSLFCELQKARQCLVLETDLHLIYLVTPYSVSSQWGEIDWLHLLTLWESLTRAMKRVGELVGVQESFIIRCLRGTKKINDIQNKLNIHKRFYTALALRDLVNEVPLSEVATKFQCARGFLQGLQQAAATFAGMVTAFCHQLGWRYMEMLISQFQDRLHFGVHSELIELMKLSTLNGARARTLFDAGFETIACIASSEAGSIENALLKAGPFQSEKVQEGDDSEDMIKRKKIKNIWITGNCGVTAREAAENLIIEARKYLELEIGVSEIKWNKPTVCNKPIFNTHEDNTKDALNMKLDDKLFKDSSSQHIILSLPQETKDEPLTRETLVPNCSKDPERNRTDDTYLSANLRPEDVEEKSGSEVIEYVTSDNINVDVEVKRSCPSILKDETIWGSMNFTEAAIENITKLRTSEKMFSPDVSFGGEFEEKAVISENVTEKLSSKSMSVKDISLFSSEGDTSSLFDESLPLDVIPSKFLDDKNIKIQPSKIFKQETISDFVSINSNSILNAFKSTLLDVDTDEDIKLVYEEDNKISENELETVLNLSKDAEVIETQNISETKVKNSYISPYKRYNKSALNHTRQLGNKKSDNPRLSCQLSKIFRFEIGNNEAKCYVLKKNDILDNFDIIGNVNEAAIHLDIMNATMATNEVIGSNIIKQSRPKQNELIPVRLIKGITLYFRQDTCFYIDLASLETCFSEVKSKLINWLQRKSTKLRLMYLKSSYVNVKKCFGVDLLTDCVDISITEWLLNSDEKVPDLTFLTKKYCHIDLQSSSIKIDNKEKKFKNLDNVDSSIVRTWCIWKIADKQEIGLADQYQRLRSVMDLEIRTARVLADCEYYGLAVDKDLTSQLLNDVKSSQEMLQRRAYQMCGYHFNFNSSKDVAKVLGMYKGRQVSTKKRVLTSHNSPMASIVIYWRKLNAILTKTLYPLTEKAVIYSDGNRITPSYTMYTNTGRISMHDPNLQSVPRTFTVPAEYLSNTQLSGDIIEFNCRRIFRAAPGYTLVSADYCQLEMRILTHYSEDEVLMRIMKSNVDVFRAIAASWGQVDEDQVWILNSLKQRESEKWLQSPVDSLTRMLNAGHRNVTYRNL